MPIIQRVVKATTHKGKKALLKKEPQVIEGPKRAIFIQGRRSSDKLRALTKDLYDMKKPDAFMLSKKNDITVFENATLVEAFCRKFDAPLFVLSSHSKKRPDNLVIGRMYNNTLLDMIELHVEDIKLMREFACEKIMLGTKPVLVFNGPEWEETDEFKHLKSLLIDLFHREEVECIRVKGLEHTIGFTVTPEKKIRIRSYKVMTKKSGETVPLVELEEMGPRMDLCLRRSKLPSEDLMKEALRKPKELKVGKTKNVTVDVLGTKRGRVHVGKQEIKKIQTRKMKGLKKSPQEKKGVKRVATDNNNIDRVKKQKTV